MSSFLEADPNHRNFSVASVTKDYNFAWIENKKKLLPINFDPKIVTKTQNLKPIIQ